jgi:geranylgeranyl diphosphate synthase type I
MVSPQRPDPASDLERYALDVRTRVDRGLSEGLARERLLAESLSSSAELGQVHDALASLAMRGGKRLRSVLVSLAYDGLRAASDPDAQVVVDACVAIELLQVYLLVHDDWMDGDDTRRGGPTVHRALGEALGPSPLVDHVTVLAGDLASAMAQAALARAPLPSSRVAAALARFADMQRAVVAGQIDDVCASRRPLEALDPAAVERLHANKTGSYSVAGPLALGALLAGATAERVAALDAFAQPLGVAFQLRDDLLGIFGEPERTGKPRFGDLREGKRTALVAALVGSPGGLSLARDVLGRRDATDAECARVAQAMVERGCKQQVEARVGALTALAHERAAAVGLRPEVEALLIAAGSALTERSR